MIDKPKPILRLYLKDECHLCDDMKSELYKIKDDYGFDFEIHDVSTLHGSAQDYSDIVPVLLWGPDVICYHKLDKRLLSKALGVKVKAKV